MFLSRGNLRDANILYKQCIGHEDVFASTPLLRCVRFLLQTLERDALPLFRLLMYKYKPSLQRDPAIIQLLHGVAKEFFNVEPPKPQGMGGILQMMMGGS